MLSMRDYEDLELVRQERLREVEHQRLVDLVSRRENSRFQDLLDLLRERSNRLRRQVENRSLVS